MYIHGDMGCIELAIWYDVWMCLKIEDTWDTPEYGYIVGESDGSWRVKCKVYTIGYPIFRYVQRMRTAQNQEMHIESKNIQTTNLYRFWLESLAGLWHRAPMVDPLGWTMMDGCPKHSRNPGWICKISMFLGKEQFQIALRWWFFPKSFHVPTHLVLRLVHPRGLRSKNELPAQSGCAVTGKPLHLNLAGHVFSWPKQIHLIRPRILLIWIVSRYHLTLVSTSFLTLLESVVHYLGQFHSSTEVITEGRCKTCTCSAALAGCVPG